MEEDDDPLSTEDGDAPVEAEQIIEVTEDVMLVWQGSIESKSIRDLSLSSEPQDKAIIDYYR